jgi:hypothetical protein
MAQQRMSGGETTKSETPVTHQTARRILLAATALLSPAMPALADGRNLTVVELFQSQGCSSCPPANANVIALSDRPDILTLSFGVTYWDHLGWKDTFAKPQYTDRQWDYAHAFHRDQVFTPEVVVNGRADVVGQNRAELEALIRREPASADGPRVSIAGGEVQVSAADKVTGNADVWFVRYDPKIEQVPIARGENEGRTLPHKNVVKELVRIGTWSGHAQTFPIPQGAPDGLRDAVIVQQGSGGTILAAARG